MMISLQLQNMGLHQAFGGEYTAHPGGWNIVLQDWGFPGKEFLGLQKVSLRIELQRYTNTSVA